MYPLPANVQDALVNGAQMGGHINIMRAGVTLASPSFETASITVDRTAACRRTGKVTLVDTDGTLTPQDPSSMLAANGNEIRVWYDIFLPGGGTFSVPMATLTIVTTTVEDSGIDCTITVEGSDRSWDFQQRKFVQPYTVAAGQPVDQAITDMLNFAWSGSGPLVYNLGLTDATTPAPAGVIKQSKDPWTQATLLANSAGFEMYPDVMGTIVAQPTPDPTTQPVVWQFDEQVPSGMKGAKRVFTRSGVFSAFEVTGTGSVATVLASGKTSSKSVPILAYVEDTDPSSPTYAAGPFGVVPSIQRTTLVTSQAQGDAMVQTQLAQQKGTLDSLELTVVPNPAIDVDDVVFVRRSRLNVSGLYVVDSVTTNIDYAASMTIALRNVS
jgi:hypothetical protein